MRKFQDELKGLGVSERPQNERLRYKNDIFTAAFPFRRIKVIRS